MKIYGSKRARKMQAQINRRINVRQVIDPNLPRYARGPSNECSRVVCFGSKMTFQGKSFHVLL